MSYCLNPKCPKPANPKKTVVCQACGSKLILSDRYRVLKILGQGGFGATFLAADISLPGNPLCVIKQLRPNNDDPTVLEMAGELFEREAETLGRIGNHPQVPSLLNYFQDGGQFYLVQEFVKGHNLQQEVKKNGTFSEAGVEQFLSEILPILQEIHSRQVIHRDIKPANLIRRVQDKKLVLIDFGAVKNKVDLTAVANTSDQTALTSFAVGTPGFAPPEQMAMRPVYASDIYALGITCIYLLTGKSPKNLDYNAKTGELIWRKYVDINDHLASVLSKMLEVSVRGRYQSAPEVLRALDLKPYIDSLEESMVMKSSNRDKSSRDSSFGGGYSMPNHSSTFSSSQSSATSRLAMSIQARRQRQAALDPSQVDGQRGGSFSQVSRVNSPHTQGTSRKRRKIIPRWNAQEILTAYLKGRRDFAQLDLRKLDLQQVNLSGGNFHESKLNKINLRHADLSNADFGKACLNYAVLQDANLGRAYFNNANLEGANLRGADLSFAHLTNANLKGANLCGANLTKAKITEEQLAQAKVNWKTTMPDGKRGFW